jgi:hypothetical protein
VIENAATCFGGCANNSRPENLIREKNSVFLSNKCSSAYGHYFAIYYMPMEVYLVIVKTSKPFNLVLRLEQMDSEPVCKVVTGLV